MELKAPVFSIIVPTRNRAELLYACLDSILYQSFGDFECIVVDDGSTDQTRLKVESMQDDRFKFFFQGFNDRSLARNFGIDQSKGKYICFVDDDDWITKDYLEQFNKLIDASSYKNEIIRTSFYRFENNQLNKTVHYNQKKHNNPVRFIAFNMCGVGSLCIPREHLEDIKFPEQFPHWQDSYLFLLLLSEYPMIQLATHTYVYRIHDDMGSKVVVDEAQLSRRAALNIVAIEDFREQHFEKVSRFLTQKDFDFLVAEKYIQYAQQAKRFGFTNLSKTLKRKSIDKGRYLRLWKYYLTLLVS